MIDCSTAITDPSVPPFKPLKFQHQLPSADSLSSSGYGRSPAAPVHGPGLEAVMDRTERPQPSPAELRSRSLPQWQEPSPMKPLTGDALDLQPALCSYVERLRREGREEVDEGEEAGEQRGLDRSSYHHAIVALENTSEEEEEEVEEDEDKRREKERSGFQWPVIETESTFRPADFGSQLLPAENKPLEMVVLKRAKELLLSHNPHSIARHLLRANCQVHARCFQTDKNHDMI